MRKKTGEFTLPFSFVVSIRLSNFQPLVASLTNRELDVLDLLAQRLSNKEIAAELFISTTTVKGHLQNIYGKLNINRRREAVSRAGALRILTPHKG